MSLPEIFKNKIDENIKNSQYTYSSIGNNDRNHDLFNTLPVDVLIETKNRNFKARIVGKTDNYMVTNTREVIQVKDCISIKKA